MGRRLTPGSQWGLGPGHTQDICEGLVDEATLALATRSSSVSLPLGFPSAHTSWGSCPPSSPVTTSSGTGDPQGLPQQVTAGATGRCEGAARLALAIWEWLSKRPSGN